MSYSEFKAMLNSKGITKGIKAAWAVHEKRQRLHKKNTVKSLRSVRREIPVGDNPVCKREAAEARPQVTRWYSPINATRRQDHHCSRDISAGRYSSRCTFTKYDHHPLAWSVGWITCAGRYLVYQYGPQQTVLKAPKGWSWAYNAEGVHIRNTAGDADYHPSSWDLMGTGRGVKWCIAEARKNQAIRKEQDKAIKAAERAAKQEADMLRKYPAYACYVDSRKAGNCSTGTLAWMEKQAIKDTHIPVNRLQQFQDSRVARVVSVATQRHLKEIKAGVCLLADHYSEETTNANP